MSRGKPGDELAVRQLVDTYCDGVNRRDVQTWASLWAEDAVWQLPGRRLEGKAAIVELWAATVAGYRWLVQLSPNGIVEVTGDTATGRWYVDEHGALLDGSSRRLLGVYHDRYVRTSEGWRFTERRLEVLVAGDEAR
jgi:uncharacterized protein (TIGR02246 family)